MRIQGVLSIIAFVAAIAVNTAAIQAKENVTVGGTGASLGMSRLAGDAFAGGGRDITFDVVEGLGSGGSIRALIAGAVDVAFSARPLKEKESGKGVVAKPLLRTPFILMTSHGAPDAIESGSLSHFYSDPLARWSDGSTVKVILRPKSESDMGLFANFFPGVGEAIEAARKRGDIPVTETDQVNAGLAEGLAGSLTTGTLMQLLAERRRLNPVAIDGIVPTADALASGAYPYGKTFYIVYAEQPRPAVAEFVAFLQSPDWSKELRRIGAIPVE